MKWSRRIYYLDGREIRSDIVDGFLHTRRIKGVDFVCMACGKPVLSGHKYVLLNYYDTPDPIHFNCFHLPAILGVRQYRKKTYYGIMRSYVDCEKFIQKRERT